MSFVKKLNKKWADSSPLEKTIKIILLLVVFTWIGYDMWYEIADEKIIEFYSSNQTAIITPLLIALIAGIVVYFFAIYLSPPKRRIAGFIWWGIGNICLLGFAGFAVWMSLGTLECLQSPYPEVVKIGKENLYTNLPFSIYPILLSIVSWYFLIKKYKKSKIAIQ